MGRYTVHLVGESNWQAEVGRLSKGDSVQLLPEPSNQYDPRAIKAVDITGATVGYLERDSWLTGAILDQRATVHASVFKIIGGEPGKPSLGVVLEVLTAQDARDALGNPAAPSRVAHEKHPPISYTQVGPPIDTNSTQPKRKPGCMIALVGALLVLGFVAILDTTEDEPSPEQSSAPLTPSGSAKGSQAVRVGPAPSGDPLQIAAAAIQTAGHNCGKVSAAQRIKGDGSIIAACSNGRRYRIFDMQDVGTVALSCEAALKLGVDAC